MAVSGTVDDTAGNNTFVMQTENTGLEESGVGNASGGSGSSSSDKGKGKAKAHTSKNSVDIAEGGFGDGAQDDEELYS